MDVLGHPAAHPGAAHPCRVAAVGDPSALAGAVRADLRQDGREPGRLALLRRTRARILARARDHAARLGQPADGARGQVPHLDAHGAARHVDDRDRTRSGPDRQLRDTDRDFRGGGVGRDPWARTPPPLMGHRPPGAPQLARARPPAALRTGRAALPSAIFPHTLPAKPQSCWPLHSYGPAHRRYRYGTCPTRSTHPSAAIDNPSQSNRTSHPQPAKNILKKPSRRLSAGRSDIGCGRSRPDSNWRSRP